MLVYENRYEDLLGKRVGDLVVKELLPREYGEDGRVKKTEKGYAELVRYKCDCACGNETIVPRSSLISWRAKSCGCHKHGRPLGRKNYEFAKALAGEILNEGRHGCTAKQVPCRKMWRNCCWDCDDYETCDIICTKNPKNCGNYGGR